MKIGKQCSFRWMGQAADDPQLLPEASLESYHIARSDLGVREQFGRGVGVTGNLCTAAKLRTGDDSLGIWVGEWCVTAGGAARVSTSAIWDSPWIVNMVATSTRTTVVRHRGRNSASANFICMLEPHRLQH